MDGTAMTAHHKPTCNVCSITPDQWKAVVALGSLILGAITYLGVAVGTVLAADHEAVARASVEIPALKARVDKNTERINEVEKNCAMIPAMQSDVQDIKRLLMEKK